MKFGIFRIPRAGESTAKKGRPQPAHRVLHMFRNFAIFQLVWLSIALFMPGPVSVSASRGIHTIRRLPQQLSEGCPMSQHVVAVKKTKHVRECRGIYLVASSPTRTQNRGCARKSSGMCVSSSSMPCAHFLQMLRPRINKYLLNILPQKLCSLLVHSCTHLLL